MALFERDKSQEIRYTRRLRFLCALRRKHPASTGLIANPDIAAFLFTPVEHIGLIDLANLLQEPVLPISISLEFIPSYAGF